MKEYFTPKEIQQMLSDKGISVSLETIRRAIRTKKLPATKIGKEYSVHISDFEKWLRGEKE